MAKVKRKDHTKKLMRQLEKATKAAMTEAAQKLMVIAQKAVDRPYAKKRRQ